MASSEPLSEADDALLAARAGDGDIRAFEVLARRHGPLMRVYAAKLLGSAADSDDVVQEAFLTAWRGLSGLNDPSAVRSWLMRIVSYRCIDRIRARRNDVHLDDSSEFAADHADPGQAAEVRLQVEAMWRAVDRLQPDQRRCWLLRETGGYSYAEIADALQLPLSTVRGLIARARKQLLEALEEWR